MGVLLDGLLEGLEVNESFAVGRNAYYVGNGFEPRGVVGVVLHVCNKYNGTFVVGYFYFIGKAFGNFKSEYALKFVDNAGHTGACGDNNIGRGCVDVVFDGFMGLVVGKGHGGARCGGFGMCVSYIYAYLVG